MIKTLKDRRLPRRIMPIKDSTGTTTRGLTSRKMMRVLMPQNPNCQSRVMTDPEDPLLGNLVSLKIPHFLIEVARGGSVRGFLALSNQVIEEIEVRQETKKQEDFMRKTTLKAGFMTRSTLKDAERHKS
jgi:hypothetical protein